MIALLIGLLHTTQLYRLYLPAPAVPAEQSVRIMSSNLLASNSSHEALLQQVNTIDPEVIIFQEYTPQWHRILAGTLHRYPYKLVHTIDSPFGIAAYSKSPFVKAEVKSFTSLPAVDITVKTLQRDLRIFGVHPIPPMSVVTFDARNAYLAALASESLGYDGPMVVAGDFNAVPWSWHFKSLLSNGKLKSARDGHGLKPTWPGNFFPLWIPIDHILYNNKVALVDFDTGVNAGSDHKPIWAEINLH